MAVDSTTAFRNISKQPTLTLPPGDVLTTEGIAQQLQITDQEALKPGNLGPFLASQSVKYHEIVNRPEIKALEADIPAYLHDERAPVVTALSRDEQSALKDWHEQARTMLTSQSTSTDSSSSGTDDLSKQIQGFIDDATKNNPDLLKKDAASNPIDLLGDMMDNKLLEETDENKRKYQEILAMAKDPESVLLAMTWRQSMHTSALLGKAFEALKAQQDGMEKLQAHMDLKGKAMSGAEMMSANIDFQKFSTGTNQVYEVIQHTLSKHSELYTMSNSIEKDIKGVDQAIIANMKT